MTIKNIKYKHMKTKTLLQLLTLSSSIYVLAKDTNLLERINKLSEKGKEGINDVLSKSELDENGNELDFADKIIIKANELKEELYDKIEELVAQFYKKINVAHLDEIKALTENLEKSNASIALLEARINILEAK